jgi:hypothetical protein
MHALIDLLTAGVVSAPLWTVFLWGARGYRLLLALVTLVQAPVAVAGFHPPPNPALHLAVLAGGLLLTALAIFAIRPPTNPPVHVPARS